MTEQQNQICRERETGLGTKRGRRRRAISYTALLVVLAALSLMAGFETARSTFPAPKLNSALQAQGSSPSVSPVRIAAPENKRAAEFNRLPLQQQAERLLERAIDGDEASLDMLREHVDAWQGRIKNTDRLFDLVLSALNSRDLRVRAAAIDVDLAANNLSKSPDSVAQLLRQLQGAPEGRGMALWRLGSLGNRGVEPERVLDSLLNYAHDRSERTRYWAVEGLAMLGNDAAVAPLLERLTRDPSARVREQAASSLGRSGMLTREERLAAVPHLLNFADDDSLNTTTRELVYGTLRVITGAPLGNDANAWREWWAHHDPARGGSRPGTGILRA